MVPETPADDVGRPSGDLDGKPRSSVDDNDDVNSRKREREGSVEVTTPRGGITDEAKAMGLPAKKNRRAMSSSEAQPVAPTPSRPSGAAETAIRIAPVEEEEETGAKDDEEGSDEGAEKAEQDAGRQANEQLSEEPSEKSDADGEAPANETAKVQQIREKVQEMGWEEGKEAEKRAAEEEPAETGSKKPKSTAKSFADYASMPSPLLSAAPAKSSASETSSTSTKSSSLGFAAFANVQSPFLAAAARNAGSKSSSDQAVPIGDKAEDKTKNSPTSPPSSNTQTPSSTSSLLPPHPTPALGTSPGSSAFRPALGTTMAPITGGFAAFAGASPLLKATAGARSSSPFAAAAPKTAEEKEKEGERSEELQTEEEDEKRKFREKLVERELVTGEESEMVVESLRAKLYIMGEGQAWKERGTGTVRLNVQRDGSRRARLVMRSDGVLRVILNAPLFAGMSCELVQERYVRIISIEEGQLVHFAIKAFNAQSATALYDAIQDYIPLESASKTPTPAPTSPPGAGGNGSEERDGQDVEKGGEKKDHKNVKAGKDKGDDERLKKEIQTDGDEEDAEEGEQDGENDVDEGEQDREKDVDEGED